MYKLFLYLKVMQLFVNFREISRKSVPFKALARRANFYSNSHGIKHKKLALDKKDKEKALLYSSLGFPSLFSITVA
jgi:hypothetical protein